MNLVFVSMDPLLSDALQRGNVVVFLDIGIGGVSVGRLKIELFVDVAPKTCENFRQFCTVRAFSPDLWHPYIIKLYNLSCRVSINRVGCLWAIRTVLFTA